MLLFISDFSNICISDTIYLSFSGCSDAILHGICCSSNFPLLNPNFCGCLSLPNVYHYSSCHSRHFCLFRYLYESRRAWNAKIGEQDKKSGFNRYDIDIIRNPGNSRIWKTISISKQVRLRPTSTPRKSQLSQIRNSIYCFPNLAILN